MKNKNYLIGITAWIIMFPLLILNYKLIGFEKFIPKTITTLLYNLFLFGFVTIFVYITIAEFFKKQIWLKAGIIRWIIVISLFLIVSWDLSLISSQFLLLIILELPIMILSYFLAETNIEAL